MFDIEHWLLQQQNYYNNIISWRTLITAIRKVLQTKIYQNTITHNHYADNSSIGNRYYTTYIVKSLHGNVKMPQRYHPHRVRSACHRQAKSLLLYQCAQQSITQSLHCEGSWQQEADSRTLSWLVGHCTGVHSKAPHNHYIMKGADSEMTAGSWQQYFVMSGRSLYWCAQQSITQSLHYAGSSQQYFVMTGRSLYWCAQQSTTQSLHCEGSWQQEADNSYGGSWQQYFVMTGRSLYWCTQQSTTQSLDYGGSWQLYFVVTGRS